VLADGLSRSLKAGGYAVDVVASGDAADTALAAQVFDLLILDVGLPKLSGLEGLRRLRARNSTTPVLILTAADSVEQRVKGLDLGADDYMAKPFDLPELEARARALTRRAAGSAQTVLRHGPLTLDQVGHVATINDQVLDLSARELGLLEILLQRPGRLVSKEQLVDRLCSWGEEVSNNAIEALRVDVLGQFALRDDAAAVVHEVGEDAKLVAGQLDRDAVHGDARAARVERQRADADLRCDVAAGAANQRA